MNIVGMGLAIRIRRGPRGIEAQPYVFAVFTQHQVAPAAGMRSLVTAVAVADARPDGVGSGRTLAVAVLRPGCRHVRHRTPFTSRFPLAGTS